MNKQYLSLVLLLSFVTSSINASGYNFMRLALKGASLMTPSELAAARAVGKVSGAAVAEAGYPLASFVAAKPSLPSLGMRNFANLEVARLLRQATTTEIAAANSLAKSIKSGLALGIATGTAVLGSCETFVKNALNHKAAEAAAAQAAAQAAYNNSYKGMIVNAFNRNKAVLAKGAVAGAAGLTTGGLTYAAMNKFNKDGKKTNIAASAVVGAATTAGTFVKYDALSNALSSIKTPAFVTSTVDYVKPGFSLVGNAVKNNKVVAGTVLGAVVVGGLAYAFRNKLANMLSTSQSNTVEQNQGLLTSKKAELALLNSNLVALSGSASSYACSPDEARFLADVATVKTKIAACEKQITDVQTTLATQQEVAAAA